MNKADKIKVAQKLIDGMNTLTIRFCPDGVNGTGKYIKKAGGYHTKQEIKDIKKIHDRINDGMKTKKDDKDKAYSDFDGATKGKPLISKAKEKLAVEFEIEEDLNDIIDVYFDEKNKDKVGDKAIKVK